MILTDLVIFHDAVFMYKFYNKLLIIYDDFFRPAYDVHDYNTRLSSYQAFAIPKLGPTTVFSGDCGIQLLKMSFSLKRT